MTLITRKSASVAVALERVLEISLQWERLNI